MIHKDHVSAVMDVSFSPTGQEFASGSYDRTVRVFPHRSGRSREIYHTKRMQRVFCVNFSADARYGSNSLRQPSFVRFTSHACLLCCLAVFLYCLFFNGGHPGAGCTVQTTKSTLLYWK